MMLFSSSSTFLFSFFYLLLFLLLFETSRSQTNLITNPGCETGSLSGWSSSNNYNNGWYLSTLYPYTGTYYFFSQCSSSCTPLTQTVTLSVGSNYIISFWAFASGTRSFQVTIGSITLYSSFVLPTSYTYYATTFTANAASMTLTFTSTGSTRLDDVSLIMNSAAPSYTPTRSPTTTPTYLPTYLPTVTPSVTPTAQPTYSPTRIPTAAPSFTPTTAPTYTPSAVPTGVPTMIPTYTPSATPTRIPTAVPSYVPTSLPSSQPTSQPSVPTSRPSSHPSSQPTRQPSSLPSAQPTNQPSSQPSSHPSSQPSGRPSTQPSFQPSSQPSSAPTRQPSSKPSSCPTTQPTSLPSAQPTTQPTSQPSSLPSSQPSSVPSAQPSLQPTSIPSSSPSSQPSALPTVQPTSIPSTIPSSQPSDCPSTIPSTQPTAQPTSLPTCQPSSLPSSQPSNQPTSLPTNNPSSAPSSQPSSLPTSCPSGLPSVVPSSQPSTQPSCEPSMQPTGQPSGQPSTQPTSFPTVQPTAQPTNQPTNTPSSRPSSQPSSFPTSQPSCQPSTLPTTQPSSVPTGQPSNAPTSLPSSQPSSLPSSRPSIQPTSRPSALPSSQPSVHPSSQPSGIPTSAPSYRPRSLSLWKSAMFALGGYSLQSTASSLNSVQYKSVSSAFVIEGGRNDYRSINLSSTAAPLTYPRLGSMLKQANVSHVVASVGDMNRDGLQDVILANPLLSQCQVFLSTSHESPSFDAFKTQQPSYMIVGANVNEYFGWAIAALGDLNHDGSDEVMISALNSKTVYVLFGRESFPPLFNVTMMTPLDGFRIIGGKLHQDFGIAVAPGGDFNSDGFEDYVVSSRLATSQIGLAGVVYVIYGRSSISGDLRMDEMSSSDYFTVSASWNLFAGLSVDGLGDINGDGFEDIIIGSVPYAGGYVTQRSYVIYGRERGNLTSGQLSLETMIEGSDGFTIIGSGFMVAGPGDVNGDGIPDILVSSYYDWQKDANSYVLHFPGSMTSLPSSLPTSLPSSSPTILFFPTNLPSLSPRPTQRPTVIPSQSPDSSVAPTSHLSLAPTTASPTVSPTVRIQKTHKPTFSKPSLCPTRSPSIKPTLALKKPTKTRSPSFRPSPLPSVKPSTIKHQFMNATSSPFTVNLITVNGSYTQTGGNMVYEINAIGSVVIQGGKGKQGKSIYVIEAVNSNSVIITFFDTTNDVLDFRQDPYVSGLKDVSYSTNPLTLVLPPYQQTIVLKNLNTINDLSDDNFYFSVISSSSSSSSSESGLNGLNLPLTTTEFGTLIGFGALVILSICFAQISFKRTASDRKAKVNAAAKLRRRLPAVVNTPPPISIIQNQIPLEENERQDSNSSQHSSEPSVKSLRRLSILREASQLEEESSSFYSLASTSIDSKLFPGFFPFSDEETSNNGESDSFDSLSSSSEHVTEGKSIISSQSTSSSGDFSITVASRKRSWRSETSKARSEGDDALV